MIRTISIIYFALSGFAQADGLFEPPEGLLPASIPDISDTQIKQLEKYSTPDGAVQVTVMASAPITYQEKANEFVEGTLSGMKRKGFQGGQVPDIQVNGYSCKKIEGAYSFEDHEGSYSASTLVIFSSEFLYSLSLLVHESAEFEFDNVDLVDRLKIRGNPIELVSGASLPSSAFKFGEGLGQVLGTLIALFVIVLIVMRVSKNRKEQGEAHKP